MQKNQKSKKSTIEKLHMILNNTSSKKDLQSENQKYLQSLHKRIKKPYGKSVVYVHARPKHVEQNSDFLKPEVKIYPAEEEEILAFPEVKEEETVKEEQKPEEKIETVCEDEDLYEVDKVEAEGPEFLEVKPKEKAFEEEKEVSEGEIAEFKEETKDIKDEELPEWEPVNNKETKHIEVEEIKEEKTEDESKEELPLPEEEKEVTPELETTAKEELDEEFILEEEKITEPPEDKVIEIDVFKDINSIDEKTAELLLENGITSIGILRETPVKKLTKIKGIKRKTAKKIKKELSKIADEEYEKPKEVFSKEALDDNSFVEKESEDLEEWESYYEDEIPEKQLKKIKGYKHEGYTLYEKKIKVGDKKRTVHFFSKGKPEEGGPIKLPTGFQVKINKKTGVPYLKKKIKKKK